ncbi:MAG: PilZ domain-containing protein [Erysipelotrichales bacterium]|nr:PilZ domain-containing protein [Erysipelotrichales bacterium]
MYNLPSTYVGAFAELTTLDNRLLTNGKITKVGEDFIEAINGFRSMSIRRQDGEVKMSIKSGSQPAIFVKGTIYVPTDNDYRLTNLEVITEGDKRSFFRLGLNDEIDIISLSTQEFEKARLLDISLGGACVRSRLKLQVHDVLSLSLPIGKDMLQINAEIVRVLEDDPYTKYGVSFTKLPARDSDVLCNYIFKRQKDDIARLKNF